MPGWSQGVLLLKCRDLLQRLDLRSCQDRFLRLYDVKDDSGKTYYRMVPGITSDRILSAWFHHTLVGALMEFSMLHDCVTMALRSLIVFCSWETRPTVIAKVDEYQLIHLSLQDEPL